MDYLDLLLTVGLSAAFAAGLCVGLNKEPERVRYDHWETKTRLVLVYSAPDEDRRVIVEWQGESWDYAQGRLVDLLCTGRIRLGEMEGAEECMEYLGRRITGGRA